MKYPKGISKGPKGWRISLGPGGTLFTKRFPPTTPQADVEEALLKARSRSQAGRADSAGLKADVQAYLRDHFIGRAGYEERQRHLDLWITALGADTSRKGLTRDDIARVLNGWHAAGLAPDTCNKRRTALLALYHALDGKGGSNPVREIPKFRVADPLPRGLAYSDIEKAFAKLATCKTKARLQVLAYTGIRPGQLMALTPRDWDHKDHILTVRGTSKGRGTKPYVVPLMARARDALKAFDTIDAWGRFTWAPMNRMWQAAWRAAKLAEPAPVVYDLRHSFGTFVYRATGDIQAARKLLGHSSLRMTERYTLAAVPIQQKAAVLAFQRKLPPKAKRKRSA